MILSILAYATFGWIAWTVYGLLVHYRQARCLNVPILVSPVGLSNFVWLIAQDAVADHIARLPFGLGSWVRYSRRSWIWQFSDRGRIHQEYGPIIAHVTPVEIQVWIADKDVANEILRGKDRRLFDKPREDIKVIDFLGPHLMTACGETWRRHRRVVATPFNQKNLRIVWKESLYQGLAMGEHWCESSEKGVTTVWKDNETIAMNVMVSAGYLPFFPGSLRNFFKSVRAFKEHLDIMVRNAKASNSSNSSPSMSSPTTSTSQLRSDNLLSALVRHSEEMRSEDQNGQTSTVTRQAKSLSDHEIHANLFGLAFGGHETTAHTLAYALFSLTAHPHIQEWVAEEVRAVIRPHVDIESLDMDDIYPRLIRTKALMYETLRLFTPLANVLKRTLSPDGAVIQVGSRTLRIPPRAYVLPSLYALHSSEAYWGSDSLEWNPKRWVCVDDGGREKFHQPSPPGAFLPWSDGPRVCPGARFSQVEFVAVCAALLARFRLSAVRHEGEDEGTALGRVKAAIWDSTSIVTLMIRHPERISIRLTRL